MPEANLTKRALAHAFKELLQKQPFDKVGVSDICDACGVSRKTFYYHFQDKYALAEWVFDTEIIALLQKADTADRWALIDAICRYLYQSRAFYAHLMQYDGQNAFRRHFQEFLLRAVEKYLLPAPGEIDAVAACDGIPAQTARDFYAHFLADAVLVAVFHWLGGRGEAAARAVRRPAAQHRGADPHPIQPARAGKGWPGRRKLNSTKGAARRAALFFAPIRPGAAGPPGCGRPAAKAGKRWWPGARPAASPRCPTARRPP